MLRSAAWMLAAQGGRALIQLVYFAIIVRALGVYGFGLFAGALALVSVMVPFAGWGTGHLLVKQVARQPETLSVTWGNSLLIITLSGAAFTGLSLALRGWFAPVLPAGLVLLLGLSELLFARFLEMSATVFQARERLSGTAQLNVLLSVMRLVAALLFVTFHATYSVSVWGYWYLGSTILAATVGFVWVRMIYGPPRVDLSLVTGTLREGWHFSVSLASATVYNDIDKTMLTRLATPEAAGLYSAAYRVLTMAFMPVRSLLMATYPRFFQAGSGGVRGAMRLSKKLLPVTVSYGVVAALGLVIAAPVLPILFGRDYAVAVDALRMLAPIPLLQSIHYVASDTLAGSGHQVARSHIQMSIAFMNVLANLWLIPHYSWRGAVYASLLCDGALAVCLWLAVAICVRRQGEIPGALQGRSMEGT